MLSSWALLSVGSLDAADKPRVTALNKIDLLEDSTALDTSLYPNAVPISALAGRWSAGAGCWLSPMFGVSRS